ncbi:hypothetical protein MUP06_00960 [Patescibacteria group bacterium]|nr:hypothetical protein [Patescibacteria group bacterium]
MPTTSIFQLPEDFLTNVYYACLTFANDFKLPILLILAVSVGLLIFSKLTGITPSEDEE